MVRCTEPRSVTRARQLCGDWLNRRGKLGWRGVPANEYDLPRRVSALLRDVVAVGDDKGITLRCRKRATDADKVELYGAVLMSTCALYAKVDDVAAAELKVIDCFF